MQGQVPIVCLMYFTMQMQTLLKVVWILVFRNIFVKESYTIFAIHK